MMEFQIKKTSRRCHTTDRELQSGETFYSELVQEHGEFQRRDYCEEAWQGAQEDGIGWWKSQIPETDGGRVYWAPRDILLSYFESLHDNPAHADTLYVMALVLLRKKYLQLVDSGDATELMELQDKRAGKTWKIAVVPLSNEQVATIQQELGEQLFMDQPPES
ncbi:MAG: hypothetical protein ACR2NP_03555 [Pirellulaceae bacterium]